MVVLMQDMDQAHLINDWFEFLLIYIPLDFGDEVLQKEAANRFKRPFDMSLIYSVRIEVLTTKESCTPRETFYSNHINPEAVIGCVILKYFCDDIY